MVPFERLSFAFMSGLSVAPLLRDVFVVLGEEIDVALEAGWDEDVVEEAEELGMLF